MSLLHKTSWITSDDAGEVAFSIRLDKVCKFQLLWFFRRHMQSVFVFTARVIGVKLFLFVHDNQGVLVCVCVLKC